MLYYQLSTEWYRQRSSLKMFLLEYFQKKIEWFKKILKEIYKNKSFKKILNSSVPKMDPSGIPAIISEHEL